MSEFVFVSRGRGRVLLHNGRQFYSKRMYKSGAQWWRCCMKKLCKGSITIKDEKIIKEVCHAECCKADLAKNVWVETLEKCKQKVKTTNEPVPKLYEEAVNAYRDSGYDLVHESTSFDDVKSGLYKIKNKSLGVRKVAYHQDVADVVIPQKFNDFVIADYNSDGMRIIIFGTKTGIDIMQKLDHFFGDGTFKSCVSPFCQIYSVHGDCGSSLDSTFIRPLVYVLMSHRNYTAYMILFEMLKSKMPNWKPKKFTCDFEKSTVKALYDVIPEIKVKGCYYHFQESLVRKAKALNLFNTKQGRRCVFLCRNLALLPESNVSEGWAYIREQYCNYERLHPFLEYFNKYWLKKSFQKQWSVFGERHRTNNYVEGWHTSLSKNIKKYNRNLVDLIVAFKKDAKTIRKPNSRKSNNLINDQLIRETQLSMLDGHITVGHFLEILR